MTPFLRVSLGPGYRAVRGVALRALGVALGGAVTLGSFWGDGA